MKVLTISSLKGGVSKSTLALNLFHYFHGQGLSVGIIDGDVQGSISESFDGIENAPLIPRLDIQDWQQVRTLPYDLVVIDTGPYLITEEIAGIYSVSDFILLPCKASIYDVKALGETIAAYKAVREVRPHMRASVVLVQGIHSTGFNSELRDAVRQYGVPVLLSEMKNRVDYARSLEEPAGIFSTENEKAIGEMMGIATEIRNVMEI